MMSCLLYGIGSTGAKKSLERQLHEGITHPLVWRPEAFGLTHQVCISNRSEVAKPKRDTETEDISVKRHRGTWVRIQRQGGYAERRRLS